MALLDLRNLSTVATGTPKVGTYKNALAGAGERHGWAWQCLDSIILDAAYSERFRCRNEGFYGEGEALEQRLLCFPLLS